VWFARTKKHLDDHAGRGAVLPVLEGNREVDRMVESLLLDRRKDPYVQAPTAGPERRRPISGEDHRRWQPVFLTFVLVQRQSHLLQVVRALYSARGLTSGLHGGEKQPDQDSDDREDNQ